MASSFPLSERGNARGPLAVLGHFPNYIWAARQLGAQFFYIPDQKLTGMTADELWCQNRKFLQSVIAENGHFLLSTYDRKIRCNSWLARELEYLERQGVCLTDIERMSPHLPRRKQGLMWHN